MVLPLAYFSPKYPSAHFCLRTFKLVENIITKIQFKNYFVVCKNCVTGRKEGECSLTVGKLPQYPSSLTYKITGFILYLSPSSCPSCLVVSRRGNISNHPVGWGKGEAGSQKLLRALRKGCCLHTFERVTQLVK